MDVALDRALLRWRTRLAYCRGKSWALRGATIGHRVAIHAGSKVERPYGLSIGDRTTLEFRVWFKIVSNDARLTIGAYSSIGANTEFDVMRSITVGDHTLIAPNCFVTDHDHGIARGDYIDHQQSSVDAITIGSDVWIGTGVIILRGVTIGDGAVIGAGSVVKASVPANAVAVGSPVRIVRYR
jgi:acetyltransferase-like isoleucine patch superfamily enzyme